jgi:hypothetical protein
VVLQPHFNSGYTYILLFALQELCLGAELCITGVFDAMRFVVRLLTLTRPRPHRHHPGMTAAAARHQRRLAAAAAAARAAAEADCAGAPVQPLPAGRVGRGVGSLKQRRVQQQQQQQQDVLLMRQCCDGDGMLYDDGDCSSSSSSCSSSEDEGQRGRDAAGVSSRRANVGAAGVGSSCSRAQSKLQRSKSVGSDMVRIALGWALLQQECGL